jgi:predicted dehydrogenase
MRFCELIDEGTVGRPQTLDVEFREHWGAIFAVHPWLNGPSDSYLAFWQRGGGAASEHSHAFNLWQHFARHLKLGRVTEVTATLDYVERDGMSYDQLCMANLTTEAGLTGRVAQDLITKPPRKWARLQGTDGFIEWVCGYERNRDAVIFSCATGETKVETFAKNRPDDFILELQHIAAVMKGDLERSTLAIEHGLETMLVTAAAHKSSQSGRAITLDWNKGYSTAALEP